MSMNLHNAAYLIMDDITTCTVKFDNNDREYTYIITKPQIHDYNAYKLAKEAANQNAQDIPVFAIVYALSAFQIARIMKIHEVPQIDPNFATNYKHLLAIVSEDESATELSQIHASIVEALKKKQKQGVKEQILASLGITSASELLIRHENNSCNLK